MKVQTVRPIAVIGMACRYPGAGGLLELWENILARRQQFRTMPDVRLPLSEYYDPDPAAPDKTYGRRAAVIDGFHFDPVAYRIPKPAFDSADFVHWLALATALEAWKLARITPETLPKDTAGVILGNTLTGEDTRTTTLRLRWPFVQKVLHKAARARGLSAAVSADLEEAMGRLYKSVFAPITEDTLAGGLANTIAGRICNYLDLHGGGYIVDGACASSVLAIATAADYLNQGRMDLAIAGGVDVSLDTFELIGFSKATALTREDMRVYDRSGKGFIPGEGCGMVVLKRLDDARRDGDTVYAVLRGWGVSSDGKGGLTAPSADGQSKALLRAYETAGYRPQTLTFIEGHGTGTRVGDRVELEGIAGALAAHGPAEEHGVGVTSFKSIVGHTKAAAGVGGFIKAVIAVNRRVVPPTAGCAEPHTVFGESARALYPVVHGSVRRPDEMLRAGISAMGFGGINSHVTLESGDPPAVMLQPLIAERALLASNQQTEVMPLSARDRSGLIEALRALHQEARGISVAELTDLAAHRARMDEGLDCRAAIVARSPDDFLARLEALERKLLEEPPASGHAWRGEHIWIGEGVQAGRAGFLFPGQGSQQLGMARVLVERFEWAASIVEQADVCVSETRQAMGASSGEPLSGLVYRPTERDPAKKLEPGWLDTLTRTENAQPAICLASLLWMERLARLGIVPVVAGGHSLGELTALAAAGAFDRATLLRIATVRGSAMSAPGEHSGAMAMLACGPPVARAILAKGSSDGYCTIANYNSPVQTIISGAREAVERAVERAVAEGFQAKVLRVSNAFHSRLVEPAAELLRKSDVVPRNASALRARVFSCMGGLELCADRDLREHLADQVVGAVDFVRMAEAVSAHCDWLIEVGPGRVLSGLVNSLDARQARPCLPVESHAGGDADLNAVVAEAFTRGVSIQWEALYDRRLVRPFVQATERKFFVSPCERELTAIEVRTQPLLEGLDAIGSLHGANEAVPDLASLSSRLAAVFADATNALHAALFLHDDAHDELSIVYPPDSSMGSFPAGLGIAGAVFRSGASEIIEVLGDDPRFQQEVEGHKDQGGWTALYVPLVTAPSRKPAGVVRVLRDSRDCFGPVDANILVELARAATPALVQAHLQESIRQARRIEGLLWDLAETRAEDQTLASLLATIIDSAKAMFAAERGSVFLYDRATDELYSLIADTEPSTASAGHRLAQIRFPADRGIAGHVLRTMRPVHIANAYADERFNAEVDRTTGFQTRTIDCVPLLTKSGEAIGVLQILNRRFPGDRERFRQMGLQAAAMIAHQKLIDELRGSVHALKSASPGTQTAAGGDLPADRPQAQVLAAAPTGAGGSEMVRTVLLDLISARTGFAVDTLADDARLVDDLNLDSIKIGSLLADAAIRLGLQGKVDPAGLGGETIGGVISAFAAAAGPTDAASETATDVLLQLIADRTGFGRETLSPDLRLLDDLNLDSIKAAALLGELALRMKVEGRVDVASLANATLSEIAARVQAVIGEHPGSAESAERGVSRRERRAPWVRDFVTSVVEMPLPVPRDGWAAGMEGAVLVIAGEPRHPIAERLADRIGARVVSRSSVASAELPNPMRALVVVLPEPDRKSSNPSAMALVDELSLLHEVASRVPERWAQLRSVSFVQWTGGRFGLDGTFGAARAFAASLSLERPDLEVRVVDLDSSLEAKLAADLVFRELATDGRYRAAGYDRADRCHVPVMSLVDAGEAGIREISWSKDDVFLVTGGGKGITAECALELARLTGAKFAIVGRSQPPKPDDRESELARVLQRFQDAGVEHRYYAADVADREAVERVVRAVRSELGPVTGVFHGAGTNVPRKVVEVSAADAKAEIAPKVLGAENLLDLLASSPPKLFSAFTSIIGVTGMMNNAWYAYSNEAVDRRLRRFRTEHPSTTVLSYAFSVWDDVGMGVRLGSVQHLAQLGIDAIPVEEGVRHFARWILKEPPDSELIVIAGAAALATWVREPAVPAPALRFSGRAVLYEPGIELATRVELDARHDLFLADHNFRGSLLFPTVMGLEAMAQAALRAAGTPGLEVARIEDVRLERPIVVEQGRPSVIEIRALVLERERASDQRTVEASIHTEQTGFGPAHFAARFVLGERVASSEDVVPPSKAVPLDIVPEEDLYGSVLFQGPLFQRLRSIEALDERHVVFTTEARADTVSRPEGFSPEVRAPLVLGDPYYRDALLQAPQLSVTPEVCLPIRIGRLEFYEPAHAASGRCWAEATIVGREDGRIFGDVVVRNAAGRLVERLTGYEVKVLERRADFPAPSDLVDPDLRDERLLRREIEARTQKLGLTAPTVVLRNARGLHERTKEERHSIEHPVLREALERALGESGDVMTDLEVKWLPSGKPVVVSQVPDPTRVVE